MIFESLKDIDIRESLYIWKFLPRVNVKSIFYLRVCNTPSWSISYSFRCLIPFLRFYLISSTLNYSGSREGISEIDGIIPSERWRVRKCIPRRRRTLCFRWDDYSLLAIIRRLSFRNSKIEETKIRSGCIKQRRCLQGAESMFCKV